MEELNELQEQVKILEERVYVLERQEATRKVKNWIKILFKVLILVAVVIGSFLAYNYVVDELPKLIENKIKETGNEAVNKVKDTIKGNNH
jgi:hypothetical protein